jgi:hypothetical protein
MDFSQITSSKNTIQSKILWKQKIPTQQKFYFLKNIPQRQIIPIDNKTLKGIKKLPRKKRCKHKRTK